jgi:cation diffusion facilitator family transporter
MHLAAKPPNDRFPFGRASERYFWPFVVALLLFSVGGAFAIFDGAYQLLHPRREPQALVWSYGVLGVSLALEGMSIRVAIAEFRKLAGGRTLVEALLGSRDPTIPLVLAEDATAILGLLLALVAVGLTGATGLAFWDPVGSIVIGVLLCAVAVGLAWITHGLLIGESATPEDRTRVLELTREVDGVDGITQILTLHLGPDVVLLAMKIAFRATMNLEQIEDVTNHIEARIRGAMPHMRKIFIEADSHGDMRGVGPRA